VCQYYPLLLLLELGLRLPFSYAVQLCTTTATIPPLTVLKGLPGVAYTPSGAAPAFGSSLLASLKVCTTSETEGYVWQLTTSFVHDASYPVPANPAWSLLC